MSKLSFYKTNEHSMSSHILSALVEINGEQHYILIFASIWNMMDRRFCHETKKKVPVS